MTPDRGRPARTYDLDQRDRGATADDCPARSPCHREAHPQPRADRERADARRLAKVGHIDRRQVARPARHSLVSADDGHRAVGVVEDVVANRTQHTRR